MVWLVDETTLYALSAAFVARITQPDPTLPTVSESLEIVQVPLETE